MMNLRSTVDAGAPAQTAPPQVATAVTTNADAATSNHEVNPLWLLVTGSALFFAVAAALIAAS
jgi:hypothetical protein